MALFGKGAALEEASAGTPRDYCTVHCAFDKYDVPHFTAGVDGNGNLNMKWNGDGKWQVSETFKTKPYLAVPAPDAEA